MGVSDSGISGDREFPSTSWSVIVHAQDPTSPDYARHLRRLVELYWRPVYCVIRQAWARRHDDAKDLTQEFFATVVLDRELVRSYAPERGSFRTLLRTALSRFMQDVARGTGRQKRGGGSMPVSLDGVGEETVDPVPGAEAMTPEQIFDLAWNEAVMSEAVALLGKRLRAEGKAAAFEVFRRYDFEGDSAEMSYAEIGAALSMTAPQVKHALGQARTAFREIVTDLVRGYVDDPADLAAELRSLFGA
jgi:RNA polymerase sigma factor (sigma-70 family)